MAKKARNPRDENESRDTKFTADFFEKAHKQRDLYDASIKRLTELLGDYGPFESRKELYSSRLNIFDTTLALFRDNRNFDKRHCDEHFDIVRKVPSKQRRNLSIGTFGQFQHANKKRKPVETKPPIKVSTLFHAVSMKVVPHADKYSTIPQAGIRRLLLCFESQIEIIRFDICSGRKNDLLSGFIAIHHPKQKDMIIRIYLSNQKTLLFTNDLIEGGYVTPNDVIRMTLCINKYTLEDGMLARVFLDDLRSHNKEIYAEIRNIEARQHEVRNGVPMTTIKKKMAQGNICLVDKWQWPVRDPRKRQNDKVILDLEKPIWSNVARKRKIEATTEQSSSKSAKHGDITLATLCLKLALEVKKLERHEAVLEKWRHDWQVTVAGYSEERMIAENVEHEYKINNERGIERVKRKRNLIEQLKKQIKIHSGTLNLLASNNVATKTTASPFN